MSSNPLFAKAVDLFDAANAEDPQRVDGVAGEMLYARRMTHWLAELYPDASEELQLAARCQHIRRWMIPRSTYPKTRAGYHQWRTRLYSFHADTAAEILRQVGYDPARIDRVRALLKKERLKTDAQTQALEDVACLVFLENYFAEFAARQEAEKMVTILRRTWAKMSPRAHGAALQLQLPDAARKLMEQALAK